MTLTIPDERIGNLKLDEQEAVTDVAMIFVRCRGGVSHNPAEAIIPADAAVGARVLLRFIKDFAPTRELAA